MPINYSLLFGDAASQTFPATAAGTYTLSTPLAAGLYEITTDTSQSSFTLGLGTSTGYRFTGTIRGGKGYITVPTTSNRIVIPAGMTYPANINIRLGSYTMMAAPTGTSVTLTSGNIGTIAWTNPSGSTDTIAYWRDGTNTSLATTTSPKTSVTISGATHNALAYGLLVGKDANGIIGIASEFVSASNVILPISGGTATYVTSGPTTYLVNTFTGTGTLNVNTISNIEYLVVAGGGSGATGGGGGGGMLTGTRTSAAVGSFTVTVGAGGAGRSGVRGTSGLQGNSGGLSSIAFASAITAAGGGGGGMTLAANAALTTDQNGANGGSGGGGGSNYNTGGTCSGGTASAGNSGGTGSPSSGTSWGRGGGGGGAGAAGVAVSSYVPGNGGNGLASSISGTSVTYSGGGGGGGASPSSTYSTGGTGGGTAGSTGNVGISAAANTGGGSGGVNGIPTPGYGMTGSGGSGIVIVRVAL